ncbi:MAG: plasmid replication initiator TrfA [Rhodopila sp.]
MVGDAEPKGALDRALEKLGNALAEAAKNESQPTTQQAVVVQFPLFPEQRRPVSNDVARSVLFSCVQGKDREMVKDTLIASLDGVEIRFTGEQLNQDDHDVLMQLVHMAAHKPLGEWITIPAHTLLKILGRNSGKSQHQQLRADIARLVAGTVSLRNRKARIEYFGHLVEKAVQSEESRYWMFKLNPDLRALYGRVNHTLIDWEQRRGLRGKDLARWLQLYIATHAAPFPVKVATLRELSGSKARALKKFREGLRRALQDLTHNGDISGWSIDPKADLVTVTRGDAVTDSQRRHLTMQTRRPKKGRTRH